jgi:arylformamidase
MSSRGDAVLDVTVPIRSGMLVYPGDPEVHLERVSSIADGEPTNVTRLELGAHTATHIDAPLHYIDDAPGWKRSRSARRLVEAGVGLVGIDYLSIGDEETHHVLLRAGVVPLEGLDLRAVQPDSYRLTCLPIRIEGAGAAPARVLLEREPKPTDM